MLLRKQLSGEETAVERTLDDGRDRVGDELVDAFVRASRALVGVAVRSLSAAPVEVTLVQHRMLVLLAGGGDQTVGALADQLGVDPSNASRLCDRLQRLGLIRRRRSESDGRAVCVSLETPGVRLLESVAANRRQEIQRILAGVPADQTGAMVAALTSFSEAAHESADADWVWHAW